MQILLQTSLRWIETETDRRMLKKVAAALGPIAAKNEMFCVKKGNDT